MQFFSKVRPILRGSVLIWQRINLHKVNHFPNQGTRCPGFLCYTDYTICDVASDLLCIVMPSNAIFEIA